MSTRIQNVSPKEYNGIKYRSTLEADTAKVLDALDIPFRYEDIRYEVFKGFRSKYQKDKVQSIFYTPDFILGDFLIIECKGFETPEWRMKRKLVFKYLEENEPQMVFHQTHDCRKSLLETLDKYWMRLGYAIRVTRKPTKRTVFPSSTFTSISEAMEALSIKKPIGNILRSLMGKSTYIYNFKWELIKLKI